MQGEMADLYRYNMLSDVRKDLAQNREPVAHKVIDSIYCDQSRELIMGRPKTLIESFSRRGSPDISTEGK